MKFLNRDSLFVSLCLLMIAFFSYLLYADYMAEIDRASTDEIGVIVFKKNVAQRRFTAQAIWGRLEDNTPVYNYDSIRTDNDSLAMIYLKDGTEIELNSNTLVTLILSEDLLDVRLDGGVLSAQRDSAGAASGSGMRISTGDASVDMSDGGLIVTRDEADSLSVNVASGSANIRSATGETRLEGNQAASVSAAGETEVKKINYSLENPPNAAVYLTAAQSYAIDFAWQGGGNEQKELLISRDAFFRNIATRERNITGSARRVNLQPGTYFWKVQSSDGESPVSKVTLLQETTPRQVSPSENELFTYTSGTPMIRFRWSQATYSSSYQVEIFTDRALNNRLLVLPSRSTSIATSELPEGEYFWRVRNVYGANVLGDEVVTNVQPFKVERRSTITAPAVPAGSTNTTVSSFALQNGRETLTWNAVPGANEYVLQVARDENFNQIVIEQKTRYNSFVLPTNMEQGEYYWRVRAIAGDLESENSPEQRFSITEMAKINTTFPTQGRSFLSTDMNFSFTWADANRGRNYLLEISSDTEFRNIVAKENVSGRRFSAPRLSAGNYFWRVTLIDSSGNPVAASNVSDFSVRAISPPPSIVSPSAWRSLDLAEIENVELKWNRSGNETHYRITIYENAVSNRNIVFNEVITETFFTIEDVSKLKRADYFWTVTGLTRIGTNLEPATEEARSSFKIDLSRRLFIPRIIVPTEIVLESRE